MEIPVLPLTLFITNTKYTFYWKKFILYYSFKCSKLNVKNYGCLTVQQLLDITQYSWRTKKRQNRNGNGAANSALLST